MYAKRTKIAYTVICLLAVTCFALPTRVIAERAGGLEDTRNTNQQRKLGGEKKGPLAAPAATQPNPPKAIFAAKIDSLEELVKDLRAQNEKLKKKAEQDAEEITWLKNTNERKGPAWKILGVTIARNSFFIGFGTALLLCIPIAVFRSYRREHRQKEHVPGQNNPAPVQTQLDQKNHGSRPPQYAPNPHTPESATAKMAATESAPVPSVQGAEVTPPGPPKPQKLQRYFSPDKNKRLLPDHGKLQIENNTDLFQLEYIDGDNSAIVHLAIPFDNSHVLRHYDYIQGREDVLKGYIKGTGYGQNQAVQTKPGRAVKEGGVWRVVEPVEVEFI